MAIGALISGGFNAAIQYHETGTVQWGGLGGVVDAAGDGAMLGMAGARGQAPVSTLKNGAVQVTEGAIKDALKGSEMKTTQSAISQPAVENYVRRLERGDTAPPIKVDGKVIVEGNHRYVAGRLAGREPARTPGTLASGQASKVQPIQKLKIDKTDWGNR